MRRNYLARLIKIAALFILAYEVTNMPALTATTPSWSDSEDLASLGWGASIWNERHCGAAIGKNTCRGV